MMVHCEGKLAREPTLIAALLQLELGQDVSVALFEVSQSVEVDFFSIHLLSPCPASVDSYKAEELSDTFPYMNVRPCGKMPQTTEWSVGYHGVFRRTRRTT